MSDEADGLCDRCATEVSSDELFWPPEQDALLWGQWIGCGLCNECQAEITAKGYVS